jgi:hypothetical protein
LGYGRAYSIARAAPASDGLGVYVAKAGTTHFDKGHSKLEVELGAYTPQGQSRLPLAAGPRDRDDPTWFQEG